MGSSVRDQLESYRNASGLTRLYLGVPEQCESAAKSLLNEGGKEFADIGLLTVDEQGQVHELRSADKLEMKHDGYTVNGRVRTIGYGKVSIQSVSEFESLA